MRAETYVLEVQEPEVFCKRVAFGTFGGGRGWGVNGGGTATVFTEAAPLTGTGLLGVTHTKIEAEDREGGEVVVVQDENCYQGDVGTAALYMWCPQR